VPPDQNVDDDINQELSKVFEEAEIEEEEIDEEPSSPISKSKGKNPLSSEFQILTRSFMKALTESHSKEGVQKFHNDLNAIHG